MSRAVLHRPIGAYRWTCAVCFRSLGVLPVSGKVPGLKTARHDVRVLDTDMVAEAHVHTACMKHPAVVAAALDMFCEQHHFETRVQLN